MSRPTLARALLAVLLALPVIAVAGPAAHADWSRPGDLVTYRICKQSVADGQKWLLRNRVRAHADVPDSRARLTVRRESRRVAGWSTGWLEAGEVATVRVRVRKAPSVRIHVQQEAGDRDSEIGTAAEALVLQPRRIARCG